MTLFCRPVCWFCGLLIRRIDHDMREIHAKYRAYEDELRERDERAKQPRMGCVHTKRSRSYEQIKADQAELTEQHRSLQSKRAKFAATRTKYGLPVPLMVAAL